VKESGPKAASTGPNAGSHAVQRGCSSPTDGVVIDERLLIRADASGPRSARMVLQNPRVDFAVFEVARGGILREGLGYERNDVAVVLNVQPDHLGLRGIDTVEQLADVKAVIVETADGRDAILDGQPAADPRGLQRRAPLCGDVAELAAFVPARRLHDRVGHDGGCEVARSRQLAVERFSIGKPR